jgi:uncharacterized membrane protein
VVTLNAGHRLTNNSRLLALSERARESLFVVPTAFAVAGIALAAAALAVDENVADDLSLPLSFASTAASARSTLSTVASATMTFAGIAFSVTLLVFQMSSSQYSPRVIHGLFRDPFNKRIIGLVVGTFTYCLVVLRSVHGPLDEGPGAAVPTFSTTVSVVLGVAVVLAIVAFIDHNAHRMDVSRILRDVTDQTLERADDRWWPEEGASTAAGPLPTAEPGVVTCASSGWVQQIDAGALLGAVPEGTTLSVDVAPGHYATEGVPLCRVWPAETAEEVRSSVRRAVVTGSTRTMMQDPAYGVRQLVDVALRALSPGTNDPTTAQDAIFHLSDALRAVLQAPVPPAELTREGPRRLVLPTRSPAEVVDLAFGELRRAAAPHPAVTSYLLAAMATVATALDDGTATQEARRELARQARLAVAAAEHDGVAEWDLDALRAQLDELELA